MLRNDPVPGAFLDDLIKGAEERSLAKLEFIAHLSTAIVELALEMTPLAIRRERAAKSARSKAR